MKAYIITKTAFLSRYEVCSDDRQLQSVLVKAILLVYNKETAFLSQFEALSENLQFNSDFAQISSFSVIGAFYGRKMAIRGVNRKSSFQVRFDPNQHFQPS